MRATISPTSSLCFPAVIQHRATYCSVVTYKDNGVINVDDVDALVELGKRDIWLTETEVDVIDTPEFQRLHRIHQLDPAYLLYPGATLRFSHSLGTLYMAQLMVDAVNRNHENFRAYYERKAKEEAVAV